MTIQTEVAEMTEAEMEGALKETTDVRITETVAIGIVQNVETQTLLSELNATNVDSLEVKEMTDVVEMTDVAEMTDVVEKFTTITTGIVLNAATQISRFDKNAIAVEPLALVAAAVGVAHEEMAVEDLLDAKMAEDLLDAMVETEEAKVVIKIEDPIAKTDLQSVNQESLEPLENHVVMAQGMHIIATQNLSVGIEKTTREGEKWVLNITTSTP